MNSNSKDSTFQINVPIEGVFPAPALGTERAWKEVFDLQGARRIRVSIGNETSAEFALNHISHSPEAPKKYLHINFSLHFPNKNRKLCLAMDAVMSDSATVVPDLKVEMNVEAYRFQPLTIGEKNGIDPDHKGESMVQRGLHYAGYATSHNVYLSCICDECFQPFCLDPRFGGFADLLYFYSEDGLETLWMSFWGTVKEKDLTKEGVEEMDRQVAEMGQPGNFRFLNALRCPHCRAPYIDYVKHPEARILDLHGHEHFPKVKR